jgi:hypothetical protein
MAGVGVGSFKNRGAGVGAFVLPHLSPGRYTKAPTPNLATQDHCVYEAINRQYIYLVS